MMSFRLLSFISEFKFCRSENLLLRESGKTIPLWESYLQIIFHQREKDRHCIHSTIMFSLYFRFSIFNYISGYGLHFLIIYLKIRGT